MTVELTVRDGWHSQAKVNRMQLAQDFDVAGCQHLGDDLFRVVCENVVAQQIAADGRFTVESSKPYRPPWRGRFYEVYDETRLSVPHVAAALEAKMDVLYRPNLANTRMLVAACEPPLARIKHHADALIGVEFNGKTATQQNIEALKTIYQRDGYLAAIKAVANFYGIGWVGTGHAAQARRYIAAHRAEWEPEEG